MSEEVERKPEPIQKSVHVDCPIDEAFHLFTRRISEWWPLASHSVAGDEAETCVIEPWAGGRVFERTRVGDEHEWGSVTAWEPPGRLEFTWHPAGRADGDQLVEVEFSVEADGTRVTLTHSGWQFSGAAVCGLRAQFTTQWSAILHVSFAEFAAAEMLAAV